MVIANPPYGAIIDELSMTFAKLYPRSTKAFKDIYKMFIDKALSDLIIKGGCLIYIIPNTFIFQPRYRDIRLFLLDYNIRRIINLGENVFETVVPTAILIVSKTENSDNNVLIADLSEKARYSGTISNIKFSRVKQQIFKQTPELIFTEHIRIIKDDEIELNEILDLKDCGIKYQRVKVGMAQKGKNDLRQRLFYEGERKHRKDIKFISGKELFKGGWHIDFDKKRFMKHNYRELLKNNEIVYFNESVFNVPEKIVWRQTSSYFLGTLLDRKIWFANTLQAGLLKDKRFSLKYILALLNSTYLRHLYTQNVKESGRVFPQVKLTKLRSLPIKLISNDKQAIFNEIVEKIILIIKNNDYLQNLKRQAKVKVLEDEIDELVYQLYGLTPEEIKIVEGAK